MKQGRPRKKNRSPTTTIDTERRVEGTRTPCGTMVVASIQAQGRVQMNKMGWFTPLEVY